MPIHLYLFKEASRASVFGIGTYLNELTECLSKCANIRICIVHLNSDKPEFTMEDNEEGISRWYFPTQSMIFLPGINDDPIDRYYRNAVHLLRIYIPRRDSLVFHLNYNKNKDLAFFLKKHFDCKIVTTIHYFKWCFGLSGNLTRFRNLLRQDSITRTENPEDIAVLNSYKEEKSLFENTDHIICLSRFAFDVVHDNYGIDRGKIAVIYNGLSDRNHTKNRRVRLRRKYRLPPHIPVILFAGRLDDIKGLSYLIRAFKKVLEIIPSSRLIIAGDGSFATYLSECTDIWTNVTFTGFVDKTKLYELYSIADVGVMPSLHEQCSYVAIEMMMYGLPMIAGTSTGLKEMVEDGVSGLHIPVREYPDSVEIDVLLLAEKIMYLIQNPQIAKKLGRNARKRYETIYSSEVMRENMMCFYESLY